MARVIPLNERIPVVCRLSIRRKSSPWGAALPSPPTSSLTSTHPRWTRPVVNQKTGARRAGACGVIFYFSDCGSSSTDSPAPYLVSAYGVDLFLSANRDDVHEAARHGNPAGRIVQDNQVTPGKDPHPNELRVEINFDGDHPQIKNTPQ